MMNEIPFFLFFKVGEKVELSWSDGKWEKFCISSCKAELLFSQECAKRINLLFFRGKKKPLTF